MHAHPDDEAIFTGGLSSHYAKLGREVVLITCTNGALGFDPEGRDGSNPQHDDEGTRDTRANELAQSAKLLGFTQTFSLGYDDSGMMGWPQNEHPSAFMNADVETCARELADLFTELDAQVVVTYDERGFYGHPDHVMANVVTRRALEMAPTVQRLYYPVVPARVMHEFVSKATSLDLHLPAWVLEADFATPDELVATTLDVSRFTSQKQAAIAAHSSQIDNADLVTMDPKLFTLIFGTEYYQRAWSIDIPSDLDHTDLFGGLT